MEPSTAAREVLVEAVGGRAATGPMRVVLRDGTSVRFGFGTPARPSDRLHAGLRVDRAATRREGLRWPPSRQLAWIAEMPEEPWQRRVPRVADRFRRVLTHDAELLARGAPYERFHYGTAWARPSSEPKTRLVSMIASTRRKFPAHRLRLEAMEHARRAGVECFGRGHRPIALKNEGLDAYAFTIAMENSRRDEYFTEKLIDCFVTETVPVYWGFPSVGSLFDPRGILAFTTVRELDDVLASLSPSLYERLRPHVLENRRRVAELALDSPGLWCRLARVVLRETAGFEPVPSPPRTLRALARALGQRTAAGPSYVVHETPTASDQPPPSAR